MQWMVFSSSSIKGGIMIFVLLHLMIMSPSAVVLS
jgi:hypothetical protein